MLKSDVSDHWPYIAGLDLRSNYTSSQRRLTQRNVTDKAMLKIKSVLSQNDWGILHNMNCNEGFCYLNEKIELELNCYAPEKSTTVDSNVHVDEP